MPYYIHGEAGKTLDATPRALGTDLKVVTATVRFENLGIDRLTWTARTIDLAAGETILPDVGQRIELYQDATRYFRGWVTEARHTNYGTVVVVEGPAMWLRKMGIDSSQTSHSTTDTRPTITFVEDSVEDNITALINRAIALGAPIALGTIAAAYTIPKLQLSMVTFHDVLAELLRWVPDAIVWWDYSGAGTPTINVSRRGGMAATAYAASGGPLDDYEATGRPDLVPARVELKYVERAASGLPLYVTQADGAAVLGRVQSILISGREADTFLPPDSYESYQVQTVNANQAKDLLEPWLMFRIPEVMASRESFANRPLPVDVILANGEVLTASTNTNGTPGTYTFAQPLLQFRDVETGDEVSRVGKHLLVTDEPPEWAEGVLANAERVKVSGRIYLLEEDLLYEAGAFGGSEAPGAAAWQQAFPWTQAVKLKGYFPSFTILGKPWASVFLLALDFEFETYLTTSSIPVPTTIYRPQDYEFLAPPAGLAANLRAAQDFTPHEGRLVLSYDSSPAPANVLANTVNITGAQTPLATMAALPKSMSYDLLRRSAQLELGVPSRFAFGTLAGKVRVSPQTNITIND